MRKKIIEPKEDLLGCDCEVIVSFLKNLIWYFQSMD